jgi:hypothetical protein
MELLKRLWRLLSRKPPKQWHILVRVPGGAIHIGDVFGDKMEDVRKDVLVMVVNYMFHQGGFQAGALLMDYAVLSPEEFSVIKRKAENEEANG